MQLDELSHAELRALVGSLRQDNNALALSLAQLESRYAVAVTKVAAADVERERLETIIRVIKADRERLASFLKLLPKRYKYAFEFRDASWYEEPILKVLRDRNIALCLSDHEDAPAPWEVTAGHVYIRGHGPTGCHLRGDGQRRDCDPRLRLGR